MRTAYFLEDDLDIQDIVTSFLELELPSDFQIQTFRNLSDFRQALAQVEPQIVISDLNVLDAGPAAVVKTLRTEVPTHVPVIVASGDEEHLQHLRSEPRFSLYLKGTDFSELSRLLAKAH